LEIPPLPAPCGGSWAGAARLKFSLPAAEEQVQVTFTTKTAGLRGGRISTIRDYLL